MKMRLLITALTVMFLAACSSTKVITDYNPRANFSGYQQFVWADTSGGDKQVSPIAIDNVQTAFAEQLKNGLYKPAAKPDQADFIARYYVAEAAETIDRSPRLGIGLGSFTGNFGLSTSVGVPLGKDTVVRNIHIIIDLLNPKDMKLTWRGSLVVELNNKDPKANQIAINEAVAEIWSQFPPKP
ncbi:protein of unknown function (DUF4136) [Spongiibacter sp. IMCC21906]|jgi:hypothetical protein|uniref:DUF4136 domain-containing protein n=1 Tax=Spongiibacter sp. IMCC21906 TaxID=1620392 RepID=UPI00062DFDE9|nr:DUF4136 domain-containing protein [Spongiibacter sp. IMCC21906]AKH70492.1 protein of unknown function (DUF4136) [Spongiibacter sp. IMCC21906]